MTWSRATAIAGSAVVTLASCRIRIVRGHREPPRDLRDDGAWRWLAWGSMKSEPLATAPPQTPRLTPPGAPDRPGERPQELLPGSKGSYHGTASIRSVLSYR